MEQKPSLSTIFLQGFVKELIKNTNPSPLTVEIKEEIEENARQTHPMMPSMFQIRKPMQRIVPLPHSKQLPIRKKPMKKPMAPPMAQHQKTIPGKMARPITEEMRASLKPTKTLDTFPRPDRGTPIVRPSSPGNIDVGKLNFFIKDPRVQGIECPGPNKNLLVIKDGAMQRTKVILTAEDIKNVIQEFSEKTKIPLIEGTFKAALGNLIMTAVISEFVGSRFVLQKKNPFQPLLKGNPLKRQRF